MGKFAVKKTNAGIHFNLKAGNGEIIVTSEVYTSRSACNNGIKSVRVNSVAAVEDQTVEDFKALKNPKYELYEDKSGKFRFRLKARNGQIIATSEAYNAKSSALNGIESVRKNAPEAEIVEED